MTTPHAPLKPPGSTPFPTFARLMRWLFDRRRLGRALVGAAGAATVVGVFYAVENWRGQRAWNELRHELEARGARLDYRTFWPKPVPEEQNFAATPVVRTWFDKPYSNDTEKRWADNYSMASRHVPSLGKWRPYRNARQLADLPAWEKAFAAIRAGKLGINQEFASARLDRESRAEAAPGVLEGLKTNETILAELGQASRRPWSRYPVDYDVEFPNAIWHPQTENLWSACARLELRACAELAAGQSQAAFADVKLMLYLIDSLRTDPSLSCQWSRVHLFPKAVQPIWEGLGERAWSPEQLKEITALLQRLDLLADCKLALDAERAAALWTIDRIPKSDRFGYLFADPDSIVEGSFLAQLTRWPGWICRLMPRGWFAWDKRHYCELHELYLRSGFDPAGRRVMPSVLQANALEAERVLRDEYGRGGLRSVLKHSFATAGLLQAGNDRIIRRFCHAQITADLAAIACALERFRLARGRFPDKIEDLAPQFIAPLPTDMITGEPYKYRKDGGDHFVLYSVGWNQKDDGGTVVLNKDGAVELNSGDWVWRYPSR